MGKAEKSGTTEDANRISRNSLGCDNGWRVGGHPGNDPLQRISFLAKSLSDANRLKILLLISGKKKSVSAIVEELDLSQSLVSHHLKELKRSLLVTVERAGPFIYYKLSDARILDVMQTLADVATHLLSNRRTF